MPEDYHWHHAWSMDYRSAQQGLYDSNTRPPNFGHDILKYFALESGYVNLNNGSYGSMPNPVSRFCSALSAKVEANPDRYHRFSFKPLLIEARSAVAQLVGAHTDECVFVSNATAGVNTVVRNIDWCKDDIIIQTSTSWHSTSRTLHYISDTRPYPTLTTFPLIFPMSHAEIIESWRTFIKGLKHSHSLSDNSFISSPSPPNNEGPRILAVIDSVVANPAVYMPWKEMVAICRDEGILSLVDAAHSLGQEVNIDLEEVKPDFWVTTCHKWLFARRGSAILNQHLIRTSIPTSTHYPSPRDPPGGPSPPNFVLQHEWPGAIDFTSYMSIPAALDFRKWLGGEIVINEYCRRLAIEGGKFLAKMLGTRVLDESADAELTLNMTNVALPLPPLPIHQDQNLHLPKAIPEFLDISMLREYNVFAVSLFHNGEWWVRCSAQVFNEIGDFEKLGAALLELCREVKMLFFMPSSVVEHNSPQNYNGPPPEDGMLSDGTRKRQRDDDSDGDDARIYTPRRLSSPC